MKREEKEELRKKSLPELEKILIDLELELLQKNRKDLRGLGAFAGKGGYPFKKIKKKIAFIKMLCNEKWLFIRKSGKSGEAAK